jgi:hypothetical protein
MSLRPLAAISSQAIPLSVSETWGVRSNLAHRSVYFLPIGVKVPILRPGDAERQHFRHWNVNLESLLLLQIIAACDAPREFDCPAPGAAPCLATRIMPWIFVLCTSLHCSTARFRNIQKQYQLLPGRGQVILRDDCLIHPVVPL